MGIDFLITAGLLYLIIAFIIAQVSKKYRIKAGYVFLLAVFLTPLAGLIAILISGKGRLVTIERYVCQRCGLEHTEDHGECPHCLQEGHHVPLKRIRFKSL
ncbi:MAG: hypothetical protein U5L09_16555 [Bacteroidales bacterium]|nr:hypothetical protein [Bacteroidales bacterium]